MDRVSTSRVSLRRTSDGMAIFCLSNDRHLELDGEEWLDLMGLVLAIKAFVEFDAT